MYCKEYSYSHISAVTAIPAAECVVSPMAALSPVIEEDQLTIASLASAIVIGRSADGGAVIPFVRDSIKIGDSEQVAVAGRSHSVELSCEADAREADVMSHVANLERGIYCLLIQLGDGSRAFVAADRDTYQCTSGKSTDNNVTISIKIHNLHGIQLVKE